MEIENFLQDISSLCMVAACALVFPRWLWLQLRLANIDAFMNQIEKLVRANNTERAIKLCNAIPNEPVGQGTIAVLKAHLSGQPQNETDVIVTFNAALPGNSVNTALGGFRTFKTISFFIAAAGLVTHFLGLAGPSYFSQFWITTVAYFVLFGAATKKAVKMEHDLFLAIGRLTKLVAEGDDDGPGVDAEEDPDRGEGHQEIKQAYDDVEQSLDEIHAGGVEALLLASFKKEHKIDLKQDEMALKRIREAATKAAIELRHQTQTEVNLPFIIADQNGPHHLLVNVHRKQALVFSRKHPPAVGGMAPEPSPSLSASPFSAPAPAGSPSPLPPASPGKAVVCRNCAAPIPLEPEILAQIEGEFDLWTKVKTRCPQCGGSFFELKKNE